MKKYLEQPIKGKGLLPTLSLREAAQEFGSTAAALHNYLRLDPAAPAAVFKTGSPPVQRFQAKALRTWWQQRQTKEAK